jgi:hypothetical protein
MFDKVLITAFILVVIGTFSMRANVTKAQLVTDGLVSYWSFDEGTIVGDTVEDVWDENDGTIHR